MRILEAVILLLLLMIVTAGLSMPLWWKHAQPLIFALPDYIDGIMKNIRNYMDSFNNILKQH